VSLPAENAMFLPLQMITLIEAGRYPAGGWGCWIILINKGTSMIQLRSLAGVISGALTIFIAPIAMGADEMRTAIGGGAGAAAGAAVGQAMGGKTGAILGGAVGGGAGAAVTTQGSGQGGAVVGGAVGGAAGAAVGQAVGGKGGAVVGAGVGGASGAVVGKNVGENSAGPRRGDGYYVAPVVYGDEKKHKNKKKKNRCDEDHPGRGNAYGKYKDC
jgi:hypothetical protein